MDVFIAFKNFMINLKVLLYSCIIGFSFLMIPEYSSAQNGQVYAAVSKGGKWGYIDTTGTVQIPFNLDNAGSFSEGLANVKYGKYWGYIDKKGTFRFKPRFIAADPFHDGRALISYFDHKDSVNYRGYINKLGYLVMVLQNFEKGFDFNDGYGRILSRTGGGLQYGFKDSLDSFAIKPSYDNAQDFYEGKAAVKTGSHWGFVDMKNKTIASSQYDDAYRFENGVAYVAQGDKYSFINAKGEVVIQVPYEDVDVLAQDEMISFRDKGKIGFMDTRGKVVIKPQFSGNTLTRFKDGLAPIQGENGKYGYINKKGIFVIQPQFDDAQFFYNNFAAVKINGQYGFINRKGKMVVKPEYDQVFEFEPTDVY